MSCMGRKVWSSGQLGPTDRSDQSSRPGLLRRQDPREEAAFPTLASPTGTKTATKSSTVCARDCGSHSEERAPANTNANRQKLTYT
jgi:hypothetical protein